MTSADRPIGIFDSGVGGLTVFAQIKRYLPNETLIYLGDTARVPYGTKSADTVIRYSIENTQFLKDRNVKAVVVACNTASALALSKLEDKFDIPILGVVRPGAEEAIKATKKDVIGVIGTQATILSEAYSRALKEINSAVRVVSQACPLFVPLVEEGWLDNEVAKSAAARYLSGVTQEGMDVLILGCTHYPLLAPLIGEVLGKEIILIDSAEATAKALSILLEEKDLKKCRTTSGNTFNGDQIYVTDLPLRFETIARQFLGGQITPIRQVAL